MKQFINSTFYELKQAYLSLKQKPLFVFSVVSTMGITLGALLCVLTLAYVMLIKPLPYPEQDRLYAVEHQYINAQGGKDAVGFSYPNLINLYKNQQAFANGVLVGNFQNLLSSLPSQPIENISYVTPEFFTLFTVPMVKGRIFEQSEGLGTNNPVAVLSYDAWVKDFSQDENILSKKITVRGVSFNIIGVIANSFIEPQPSAGIKSAIWLPWDYNNDLRQQNQWAGLSNNLTYIGKLKQNITVTQAQQNISALINETWQKHVADDPFAKGMQINLKLFGLQQVILGNSPLTVILLIFGILGLVIIAVGNLINLYISHSIEQQKKIAIQTYVGASKRSIFNQFLTETVLLMLCSIVLALATAVLGFKLLALYLSAFLPRISELHFSVELLLLSGVFVVLFSYLFARVQRHTINYKNLSSLIQSSGKGTSAQISTKARKLLITAQVAVAALLILINLNLFKEATNAISTPLGFNVNNIYSLSLSFTSSARPSRKQHKEIMREFRRQITLLPQVDSISKSSSPLDPFGMNAITIEETNEKFSMQSKRVDHHYFSLIEQRILQGNTFTKEQIKNKSMVVIINDVFAKKISPENKAIGMKLDLGVHKTAVIIGVVQGVLLPGESTIPKRVYTDVPSDFQLLIKLKENQHLPRQQLIDLLQTLNKQYAVFSYISLSDDQKHQFFTQKVTAITTAFLTCLTLFLAAIGLYGILSYSTQMRRFEIGTRMAIGAKRADLIKLIIQDNAHAILLGMGISVLLISALALGFSEQLQSYLTWQLIPLFLITLGLVSLISFAACYLPLRQYINKPAVYSLQGSD